MRGKYITGLSDAIPLENKRLPAEVASRGRSGGSSCRARSSPTFEKTDPQLRSIEVARLAGRARCVALRFKGGAMGDVLCPDGLALRMGGD